MSTFVVFGKENRFAADDPSNPNIATKSEVVYGTVHLRPAHTPGMLFLGHMIGGKLDDTGDEQELPDESGDTEQFLMMNNGEEGTLTCRWTANVPRPRKGDLLELYVPVRKFVRLEIDGAGTTGTLLQPYPSGASLAAIPADITAACAAHAPISGRLIPQGSYMVSAAMVSTNAILTMSPARPAGDSELVEASYEVPEKVVYLVTKTGRSWGEKEVRSTELSVKRWDSLDGTAAISAAVTHGTRTVKNVFGYQGAATVQGF